MASGTIKAVVAKSDIVNDLNTNDSTKVLSAAQGYALSNQIATQNIKSNLTIGEKVQSNSQILKSGDVVYFSLNLTSVSEGDILVSNLGSYSPKYKCIGGVFKATDGKPIAGSVWAEESTGKLIYYGDTYNATCYCSIVYIKA